MRIMMKMRIIQEHIKQILLIPHSTGRKTARLKPSKPLQMQSRSPPCRTGQKHPRGRSRTRTLLLEGGKKQKTTPKPQRKAKPETAKEANGCRVARRRSWRIEEKAALKTNQKDILKLNPHLQRNTTASKRRVKAVERFGKSLRRELRYRQGLRSGRPAVAPKDRRTSGRVFRFSGPRRPLKSCFQTRTRRQPTLLRLQDPKCALNPCGMRKRRRKRRRNCRSIPAAGPIQCSTHRPPRQSRLLQLKVC